MVREWLSACLFTESEAVLCVIAPWVMSARNCGVSSPSWRMIRAVGWMTLAVVENSTNELGLVPSCTGQQELRSLLKSDLTFT